MSVLLLCLRTQQAELVLLIKRPQPKNEKERVQPSSHKKFPLLREGWHSQVHLRDEIQAGDPVNISQSPAPTTSGKSHPTIGHLLGLQPTQHWEMQTKPSMLKASIPAVTWAWSQRALPKRDG